MSVDADIDTSVNKRVRILGIPVDVVTMRRAVSLVSEWATSSWPRLVFVREVASLMAARDEGKLQQLHENADLIVPDGMPLVWIGRIRGHGKDIGRVSGADLVDAVCLASLKTGQSHYFYGGKPNVASIMADRLRARYPGLNIAGVYSPPMRNIGPDYQADEEFLGEAKTIRDARPDFIWVGISSPKQEYWMAEAAPIVGHGVFFGVGAAFDFHSGAVSRAPLWMQRTGLEWFHRFASEPRRLWRRYLVLAPKFLFLSATEELRIRFGAQKSADPS